MSDFLFCIFFINLYFILIYILYLCMPMKRTGPGYMELYKLYYNYYYTFGTWRPPKHNLVELTEPVGAAYNCLCLMLDEILPLQLITAKL